MNLKIPFLVSATPGGAQRTPMRGSGRLLTALVWAESAFAVLAVLSIELARLLVPVLGGIGMLGAALCALLAGVTFLVVFRLIRRLDSGEIIDPHVLLGGTALVGAGIVAVLALALAAGGASALISRLASLSRVDLHS